jgi:hypothetical protein
MRKVRRSTFEGFALSASFSSEKGIFIGLSFLYPVLVYEKSKKGIPHGKVGFTGIPIKARIMELPCPGYWEKYQARKEKITGSVIWSSK